MLIKRSVMPTVFYALTLYLRMNLREELRVLVGGSLPLPSGGRTHGRGDSYQPNAFPFGGRAHGRGRLLPTQRIAFGDVVSECVLST